MMTAISIELPNDVFSVLRKAPDEFARDLRLAAAVHWYQQGRVSQEKAACIAGLCRTDFIHALAREGVDVFQVDLDDLKEEIQRG